MRITEVESSPLPGLMSIRTTQLIFTIVERKALKRAIVILDAARKQLNEHYPGLEDGEADHRTDEIDTNLCLASAYIEDMLCVTPPDAGVVIDHQVRTS